MGSIIKYQFLSSGTARLANLISFSDRITDFLDKENAIGLIFMDISEAFDIAPHGKLSAALEAAEISGKRERLIRNKQQVERKRIASKGKASSGKEVTHRSPQRPVLTPPCFVFPQMTLGRRPH